MSITGFIVLLSVIWFITLWVLLPIGLRTQGDDGEVVEGTPESAPNNLRLGRKLLWTTVIAFAVWLPIVTLIWWFDVSIMDIDVWAWMTAEE